MKSIIFLFLYLWFFLPTSFATDTVRYPVSAKYPDPKQRYFVDVLKLALEASEETFGEYELVPVILEIPQGRTSILLETDQNIDVTWRMTTAELEQRINAIPVPLLKGLMGYRIGIIRKNDQINFPENITQQQLQKVLIGQGHDWPDTTILRANGMTVIEGFFHTLIPMLERKRFDLFLRALHEPWVEIADKPHLVVEKHILVQYPSPIFFFVNHNNKRLHERLSLGLNKALDDGRFNKLFEEHPITANILAKANLEQRSVFKLLNPLLSEKTQKIIEDKRLWH